jgi:hypothetical protein
MNGNVNFNQERRLEMKIEFKDINILKGRLLQVALVLLSIASMIGLNTALSYAQEGLAINFLATARSYTATMDVNDTADNVWQSVVNVAKKKNPGNLKIKEESKEKLRFEATKMTKNGEELMGLIKVRPVSETGCRLIFTATMGGGKPLKEDMKDMVTGILLQFCDEKGLTCKMVE